MWYSARLTLNLVLPWVSGRSHYPGMEKTQIPSGIFLLVLSPVSSPEGDVLTTSSALPVPEGCAAMWQRWGPRDRFWIHGDTHGARPSPRRGRVCPFPRNTQSLSLCSLLRFLFSFLTSYVQCHPLLSPWQERTGQWSRLFAECFTALSYPGLPTAVNASRHSLTTINIFALLLFFFFFWEAFASYRVSEVTCRPEYI